MCRIGLGTSDGNWSHGPARQPQNAPRNARAMNLSSGVSHPFYFRTVLHEIGHMLGLQNEHRSLFACAPPSPLHWFIAIGIIAS